jgi:hypothetical protein
MRWRTRWIALLTTLLAFSIVWSHPLSARTEAAEPASAPNVKEILDEARVIIFRNKQSSISSHDAVLDIPRLQLEAGNVDDALAALVEPTLGYAEPLRIEIAEAMARAGRRKDAERVMQAVEPHYCCDEDRLAGRTYLDDQVRSAFLDSQVANGDLAGARHTAAEVTTPWLRPLVCQKLGVAYAKAGDRAVSRQAFRDAAAAAVAIPIKKYRPECPRYRTNMGEHSRSGKSLMRSWTFKIGKAPQKRCSGCSNLARRLKTVCAVPTPSMRPQCARQNSAKKPPQNGCFDRRSPLATKSSHRLPARRRIKFSACRESPRHRRKRAIMTKQ